ncbi:ComF family protein [Armatimonas rosea]|uniref:Phosphoribosylpyrophosphate synthetase n=1 Tax=Armatimonas rosea TaxID=685828 RepID=A0A7W9W8W1_ARMRO|nr:phosphoribosyltransferase [Armatimonas rosea]MBB6053974.1 phosphoribosylpyrophosphate synthetase [Armatimonas rosea]
MAVFADAFSERENLEKIVTLGDYLAIKQNLETRGMLRFVKEGGESGYSARELKDAKAAAQLTRWVDALNNERKWPLKRFAEQLSPMLADGIAVAVAPSHDPFVTETPIRALAQKLAALGERVDATSCLRRHTKIRRIGYGGPSYVHLHRETIEVVSAELFSGRAVLLLDDIARSGATLRACRQLLLEHGASEVQMLALGRVWRP